MSLRGLLVAGGLLLLGGGFLLFLYETIAVYTLIFHITPPVPTITSIVIPWLKANRLWATIIAAIFVGFVTFLIIHFFAGGN